MALPGSKISCHGTKYDQPNLSGLCFASLLSHFSFRLQPVVQVVSLFSSPLLEEFVGSDSDLLQDVQVRRCTLSFHCENPPQIPSITSFNTAFKLRQAPGGACPGNLFEASERGIDEIAQIEFLLVGKADLESGIVEVDQVLDTSRRTIVEVRRARIQIP